MAIDCRIPKSSIFKSSRRLFGVALVVGLIRRPSNAAKTHPGLHICCRLLYCRVFKLPSGFLVLTEHVKDIKMERLGMRRAFQGVRLASNAFSRSALPLTHLRPLSTSSLPYILQPTFWKSLVPKPFRRDKPDFDEPVNWGPIKKIKKAREWNPATFFIVIFLLIGSMSINMITLRKDFTTYMRRSETRIGILREVVERLQKGEDFDVEKALGTGDAQQEDEWQQSECGFFVLRAPSGGTDNGTVLKEISRDESLRATKKNEKSKPAATSKPELKIEPPSEAIDTTKAKAAGYASFF